MRMAELPPDAEFALEVFRVLLGIIVVQLIIITGVDLLALQDAYDQAVVVGMVVSELEVIDAHTFTHDAEAASRQHRAKHVLTNKVAYLVSFVRDVAFLHNRLLAYPRANMVVAVWLWGNTEPVCKRSKEAYSIAVLVQMGKGSAGHWLGGGALQRAEGLERLLAFVSAFHVLKCRSVWPFILIITIMEARVDCGGRWAVVRELWHTERSQCSKGFQTLGPGHVDSTIALAG
jgi:hypothetical protein